MSETSEALVTLETLHADLQMMKALLAKALQPAAESAPLTAVELIKRWEVPGETLAFQLDNLARRCRARGLVPMKGTRGESATYMIADVVAAERFAGGKSKRRRRAA